MKLEPSMEVDRYIGSITDWRGNRLSELRAIIHTVAPELKEDWKWGVPVFVGNSLVCAISAFKDHVKINFFNGAHLQDTHQLFNSGLDSKDHRSINFGPTDAIPETRLKELVKAALQHDNS